MLLYPNAKINIGLNIVRKRTDGYHDIETVFYPIPLSDTLQLEPSQTCSDYGFSVAGIKIDAQSEDNLVIRAFRLMQAEYDIPPVDISLVKNIPFGAGLGGGSSDAAFALKAINELFELQISEDKLLQMASQLGADCPFFIKNTPVFATGIGDQFTPIELSLKNYYLLLVKPDIHVPTPEAYSAVVPESPKISLLEAVQQPIRQWKDTIKNDFEKTILVRHPKIATIKQTLYDLGAIYASMSGSGSSVFGIFENMPPYTNAFDDCFVTGGELP